MKVFRVKFNDGHKVDVDVVEFGIDCEIGKLIDSWADKHGGVNEVRSRPPVKAKGLIKADLRRSFDNGGKIEEPVEDHCQTCGEPITPKEWREGQGLCGTCIKVID